MGGKLFATLGVAALLGLGSAGGQEKKEEKRDVVLEAYYHANKLFNRKLYPLAADEYRKWLAANARHPKAAEARTGLAMSVFGQKNYKEAAPLIAALAKDPKHPQAATLLMMHGKCLLESGQAAEAEKVYAGGVSRAGLSDAIKARCRAGLIEALNRQEKWKEISAEAAVFLKTNGEGPLATRVRTRAAMAAYRLKDYAGAGSALEKLGADKKSMGQQGLYLLAECRRHLGDVKGARRMFEDVRKMEGPHVPEALNRIGMMEFETKKYDQAIKLFEELRSKHGAAPAAKSAALMLGVSWYHKKGYGQAKGFLAGIGSAEAEFWRARCALGENKLPEAVTILRGAIAKFPKEDRLPDLRFELANALFKSGAFGEAAAVYGEIVKAHPKFPLLGEARRLRAFCLHKEKKYAESLAAGEEALKAGAEGAVKEELAFLRGENLFLLNRGAEAAAAFREFVAKHATSKQVPTANLRIGQVLYGEEKWAEAGKVFEALAGKKQKREGLFLDVDFFAGECAFGAGDKAKAGKHYESYLASAAPDRKYRDTAQYKLASIYAESGRNPDALRVYGELAAKFSNSPHRPAALIESGRLHYVAKNNAGAKAQLAQFVAAYAGHELRPRAEYYLGWVALAGKQDAEAMVHFAAVVAKPEAAGETLASDARFQLARLAVRAEDYPGAVRALEALSASEKDPARLEEVNYYLGYSRARQKQWGPAREALVKLSGVAKSEFRERALYELAWCEKELKKPAEARRWYEVLTKEYAKGELAKTATLELAELEYAAGDRAAATSRLQPLLDSPDRILAARAAYRLGWCHYQDGKLAEAAQAFEKMLSIGEAPGELVAVAAYQAGEAKLQLKDFAGALPHYARSGEAGEKTGDPVAEQAWLRLAEVQGIAGKHGDALATCDRFLAKYGKSEHLARVQFAKGWALENLGRRDEAIAEYAKVLAGGKRDTTSARSQFQTGECYLAQGKFDEAIKAFVKVEVSFGKSEWTPKALLEIGTALERKGEAARAREQYEEVVKTYPDSASAKVATRRLGKK